MRQTVSATPRVSILRENPITDSRSSATDPFHSLRKRRMIATAGGVYDVPAFRPTSQSRSAVTAYSSIPHTTVRAILDQAETGEHLDRSGGFPAPGDRRITGDPLARR